MPFQGIGTWSRVDVAGLPDFLTVQGVVVASVLEILPQPLADFELALRRHGNLAEIEELMDVRPKEEPVAQLVLAAVRISSDVSCIEDR